MTEKETGVIILQATGCQELPEAKKKAQNRVSTSIFRETERELSLPDTLISDF